jgi:hypothetical protein
MHFLRLLKRSGLPGKISLIRHLDAIRSVKVSGKKVNVALDKELRER